MEESVFEVNIKGPGRNLIDIIWTEGSAKVKCTREEQMQMQLVISNVAGGKKYFSLLLHGVKVREVVPHTCEQLGGASYQFRIPLEQLFGAENESFASLRLNTGMSSANALISDQQKSLCSLVFSIFVFWRILVLTEQFGKEFETFCQLNNQKPTDSLWKSWLQSIKPIVTVKQQKPRSDRRVVGASENEEKKEDEEQKQPENAAAARRGKRKGIRALKIDKIPNKYLPRLNKWSCPRMYLHFYSERL